MQRLVSAFRHYRDGLTTGRVTSSHHDSSLRKSFQNQLEILYYGMDWKHSHGDDAALRTSTSYAIANWLSSIGYDPYFVSKSTRDEDFDGSHVWKIPKDLQVDKCKDAIKPNTAFVLIDVDYYLNIAEYAAYDLPIVIYTFAPTCLAQREGNTTYELQSDGKFHVHVDGGGYYEHTIWDYDHDTLSFETAMGIHVYQVDHKTFKQTPNRKIVLLSPSRAFFAPRSWFVSSELIQRNPLHRKIFGNGHKITYNPPGSGSIGKFTGKFKHAVMNMFQHTPQEYVKRVKNRPICGAASYVDAYPMTNRYVWEGEECISVLAYEYVTAEVPLRAYKTCEMKQIDDGKPNLAVIERTLKKTTGNADLDTVLDSYAIFHALSTKKPISTARVTLGGQIPVKHPTVYTAQVDDPQASELLELQQRTTALVIGDAIVSHPCVLASQGINNQISAVKDRIIGPQAKNVRPSRARYVHAREFVVRLVRGDTGFGTPILKTDVIEKQSKRRQRARSARCMPILAGVEWARGNTHIKNEPKSDVAVPRGITGTNNKFQLELQSFCIPAKETLSVHDWYCPGRNTNWIADRVVETSRRYGAVIETDFTKFDGTVNLWLRQYIETAFFHRWVAPKFRKTCLSLIRSEYNMASTTKDGYKFNFNGQRISGTPLTTIGNTLICGYVQYCALRECGNNADDSFRMLGCCFGDDGLLGLSNTHLPRIITRISEEVGLKLKCNVRRPGDVVTFLARNFIPWDGEVGSIQDPQRSYPKLHISVNTCYKIDTIRANKAAGLLALDPNAPVTSDYARYLQRLSGNAKPSDDNDDTNYVVKEGGTWPQMERNQALQLIADVFNITTNGVEARIREIRRARVVGDIGSEVPLFDNTPVEFKLPAQVDDEHRGGSWDKPRPQAAGR